MTDLSHDLNDLLVGREVTGLVVEDAWIDPGTASEPHGLNVTLVLDGEPDSWEATYVEADSVVGTACIDAGVLAPVSFSVYSVEEVRRVSAELA